MPLTSLWRNIVRGNRVDADLDDEMRSVHGMLVDEQVAAGASPQAAHRAAMLNLGGIEQVKERVRDQRVGRVVQSLVHDLQFASRTVRRSPGFAALAIVTLAIGIGSVTAVYSVVYGVLLRPLPYPDADRLVRLSESYDGALPLVRRGTLFSNVTYHAWRSAGFKTIESIEGFTTGNYKTTPNGETQRVWASSVTPGLFHLLGAIPAAGRLLVESDARDDAAPVVVLSDAFWRQRLGGDKAAIGHTVVISGRPHTIVGIAPREFAFPDSRVSFWIPMTIPEPTGPVPNPRFTTFRALAHLRSGAVPEQAAAEGTTIARRRSPKPLAARLTFGEGGPAIVSVQNISDEMTAGITPALLAVTAGVSCLLLLVSVSLAILLLSRGVVRRRELAVRAAIGAGRGRLVRELLAENLVIAFLGCAAGCAIAVALVRMAPAIAPLDFPRLESVRIDWRLAAIAIVMASLASAVTSLSPAFSVRRLKAAEALASHDALTTGFRTTGSQRAMTALLTIESAFCVLLLVGALLLARSVGSLLAVDSGYTPEQAMAVTILRPGTDRDSADRYAPLMQTALARIRAMPGVTAAAISSMTPLDDNSSLSAFPVPGSQTEAELRNPQRGPAARTATARIYNVTPGYERAMGLRLREGRFFDESDKTGEDARWVVNEEFVRRYFPSSPAGHRFPWTRANKLIQLEIIGVVANVLKEGNDARPQPEVYFLMKDGDPFYDAQLVIRTAGDPVAIAPDVRRIVREAAPDAGVEIAALTSRMDDSVAQPRCAATVFVALAICSLALGAVGLVAALVYQLSRRRREFGIRIAAGARPADLIRLSMRQGLTPIVLGTVIGLVAAGWAAQLIRGALFGIAPLDLVSFLGGPAILIPLATLACLVPALHAARVDPVVALRHD